MQRSQSDDNARHAGLRPDPLIRESKEEAWRHRSIHAPTPYEKLKLHGIRTRRTNQDILVQALDVYLATVENP